MYGDSARIVIATIRTLRDTSKHDAALVFAEADRIAQRLTQTSSVRLVRRRPLAPGRARRASTVVARRCDEAVDALDEIIHDLRTTVCGMKIRKTADAPELL